MVTTSDDCPCYKGVETPIKKAQFELRFIKYLTISGSMSMRSYVYVVCRVQHSGYSTRRQAHQEEMYIHC
jgi:hypothetical protein